MSDLYGDLQMSEFVDEVEPKEYEFGMSRISEEEMLKDGWFGMEVEAWA